jgi:hypothetical protein
MINEVVAIEVSRIDGAELVELNVQHNQDKLNMVITVRTTSLLRYEQVTELQKSIATSLQKPVSLKVNQVFAEQFDPLVPPTFTPTLTLTPTNTPGPAPTATLTPTYVPTFTSTPTLTATPASVQIVNVVLPKMNIYQSPNGPVIGQVRVGQNLILLYDREEANGLVWVQVMDEEGRIGWIPEIYLKQVTPTPSQ